MVFVSDSFFIYVCLFVRSLIYVTIKKIPGIETTIKDIQLWIYRDRKTPTHEVPLNEHMYAIKRKQMTNQSATMNSTFNVVVFSNMNWFYTLTNYLNGISLLKCDIYHKWITLVPKIIKINEKVIDVCWTLPVTPNSLNSLNSRTPTDKKLPVRVCFETQVTSDVTTLYRQIEVVCELSKGKIRVDLSRIFLLDDEKLLPNVILTLQLGPVTISTKSTSLEISYTFTRFSSLSSSPSFSYSTLSSLLVHPSSNSSNSSNSP